ncbi:MAG: ThuA domain-containing protein [Opitutus sp.]|nr:ThuA domain-containing protein [Opitutus sp.]
MKSLLFHSALLLALATAPLTHAADATIPNSKPVRALLITGGCCHDYALQAEAFIEGVKKYGAVTWTVVNEGGTTKNAKIALYDNPDWAKPYDVVVHNECFADLDDPVYIRKITAAHRAGVPAIVIHCAMHTYRVTAADDWREFLGVTSRRHDHQSKYPVTPVVKAHAAMLGFPASWVTPMDELYVIEKLWPGAKALATSVSEADGKTYPVIWANDYHGTRVFGTTFGHGNATWHDPVFIAVISHGLLWAAGREN